jgi:putative ABC transport system ATP-binding protein
LLILADEPTGNLDSVASGRVLEIIRRLNEDRQATFIVVTHDPAVNAYADRLVSIRDGELSEQEARAEEETYVVAHRVA